MRLQYEVHYLFIKVYAPCTVEITDVNEELTDTPKLINEDCFGKGWLVKVKMSDFKTEGLLNEADYEKFLETCEKHH